MKIFMYFLIALVLVIGGGFVSDEISQIRSRQVTVNVEVNDANVFDETQISFSRQNTLTSSGKGYEVYLVSQEVDIDSTFISDRNADQFFLVSIIDFQTTSFGGFGKRNTNTTKIFYELVCAPAGLTTGEQVMAYSYLHNFPLPGPTFLLDGTDLAIPYTLKCQQ